MRILLCSDQPLSRELGASKVLIELAEALRELGCACTVVGSPDICGTVREPGLAGCRAYASGLQRYLLETAGEFDVVDYPHTYLPFPRETFCRQTLFVARSVLLTHHLRSIRPPVPRTCRALAAHWARMLHTQRYHREVIRMATRTAQEADLVNVSNDDDRKELVRYGIHPSKIVVIPYGLSAELRPLFDAVPISLPAVPVVCFVGTFDHRKGAADMPRIARDVCQAVPGVRFRLLGTAGMYRTEREVLAHFPNRLRDRIEVIPRFAPEQLPQLLAPCSLGIFPSYMEGFGFGVLEMLAAAIPVVAYDAPGPPMMLPREYLVPPGNTRDLSAKVISLLRNRAQLRAARERARQRSREFTWSQVACITREIYARRAGRVAAGLPGHRGTGVSARSDNPLPLGAK